MSTNAVALKKAVFPVAGLGTRFLPATKAIPKEMLPIVDKPLIQYAVEEAIAAGIRELIFITNYSKCSIEDYFSANDTLETKLQQRGQLELLTMVQALLPREVSCAYIRQPECLGLGHAVLCAKNVVGNEPFAVLLADDLIQEGSQGCLSEMLPLFTKTQANIIAMENIAPCDSKKYGIVSLTSTAEPYPRIANIVEKPDPDKAPSNLGVVGRYILQPSIFSALEQTALDAKDEIQLTDAIAQLLTQEAFYGYHLTGKRYDCGSKQGYLQATVNYALANPELAVAFRAHLAEQLHDRVD